MSVLSNATLSGVRELSDMTEEQKKTFDRLCLGAPSAAVATVSTTVSADNAIIKRDQREQYALGVLSMVPRTQTSDVERAQMNQRVLPAFNTMEYLNAIHEREAEWYRRLAEDRKKRNALTRLLHAIDCLDRPGQHAQAYCRKFCRPELKDTVRHMRNCSDGVDCEFPKCQETTALKAHWDECNRRLNSLCSICGTLMARIAYRNRVRGNRGRAPPPPRAG